MSSEYHLSLKLWQWINSESFNWNGTEYGQHLIHKYNFLFLEITIQKREFDALFMKWFSCYLLMSNEMRWSTSFNDFSL